MSIIKYCGSALLVCAIVTILSEFKSSLAKVTATCAGIAMLATAAVHVYPSFEELTSLACDTALGSYSSILMKAIGVAVAVEVSADICKDAGEASLANKLESVGKAELLLLALPLVNELAQTARGFVS